MQLLEETASHSWRRILLALRTSASYRSFLGCSRGKPWNEVSIEQGLEILGSPIDLSSPPDPTFLVPFENEDRFSEGDPDDPRLLTDSAIRFLAEIQLVRIPRTWKRSLNQDVSGHANPEYYWLHDFFDSDVDAYTLEFMLDQVRKRRSPGQISLAANMLSDVYRQHWRYPAVDYFVVHGYRWWRAERDLDFFLEIRRNYGEEGFPRALARFEDEERFDALRSRWRLTWDLLCLEGIDVLDQWFQPGARLLTMIREKLFDLGHLAFLAMATLEGETLDRALNALRVLHGPPPIDIVPKSERCLTDNSRNPTYLVETPIDDRITLVSVIKMYGNAKSWEAERAIAEHYRAEGLSVPLVSQELSVRIEELCLLDTERHLRDTIQRESWSGDKNSAEKLRVVHPRTAARAILTTTDSLLPQRVRFFQFLEGQQLLEICRTSEGHPALESVVAQLARIHLREPRHLARHASTAQEFTARSIKSAKRLLPDAASRITRELRELYRTGAWNPVAYYKDATPMNWIVTASGQVSAIDFETNWRAPVHFDLANLLEYGAQRTWTFRQAMLQHYRTAAGENFLGDGSEVEITYAIAVVLRSFVYCEVLGGTEHQSLVRPWCLNSQSALDILGGAQAWPAISEALQRLTPASTKDRRRT